MKGFFLFFYFLRNLDISECRKYVGFAHRMMYNFFTVDNSSVVKVLCYESQGRLFDPSWC